MRVTPNLDTCTPLHAVVVCTVGGLVGAIVVAVACVEVRRRRLRRVGATVAFGPLRYLGLSLREFGRDLASQLARLFAFFGFGDRLAATPSSTPSRWWLEREQLFDMLEEAADMLTAETPRRVEDVDDLRARIAALRPTAEARP